MNEVKFIDTSKEVKDQMRYLSRQALKSAGKVITNILKNKVNVRTGALKKSVKAWVKIDYKTGQPELNVGYLSRYQMKKRGFKYMVNPSWFEFGTKPHSIKAGTRRGVETGKKGLTDGRNKFGGNVINPGIGTKNYLRNSVFENIDEIRNAQEEYLGTLKDMIINSGGRVPEMEDEEID